MLVNGVNRPTVGVSPSDVEEKVAQLTRQVENLQEAVISRQRIGVAVGLLAHRLDCNVDQAWKLLTWISQSTNVKVRIIAQVMVDRHSRQLSAQDAELSATIEELLPQRLASAPDLERKPAVADGCR